MEVLDKQLAAKPEEKLAETLGFFESFIESVLIHLESKPIPCRSSNPLLPAIVLLFNYTDIAGNQYAMDFWCVTPPDGTTVAVLLDTWQHNVALTLEKLKEWDPPTIYPNAVDDISGQDARLAAFESTLERNIPLASVPSRVGTRYGG